MGPGAPALPLAERHRAPRAAAGRSLDNNNKNDKNDNDNNSSNNSNDNDDDDDDDNDNVASSELQK